MRRQVAKFKSSFDMKLHSSSEALCVWKFIIFYQIRSPRGRGRCPVGTAQVEETPD